MKVVTEKLHRTSSSSQAGTIYQLDSNTTNVPKGDNVFWNAPGSILQNPKFLKATAVSLRAQLKGER